MTKDDQEREGRVKTLVALATAMRRLGVHHYNDCFVTVTLGDEPVVYNATQEITNEEPEGEEEAIDRTVAELATKRRDHERKLFGASG